MGSLVAAVGSYLFARSVGGRWLVRIEDLDRPRVVPGAEGEILASLEAFGLAWDGEVVRQSERTEVYEDALATLRRDGHTFECACSRAEIRRASSAPSVHDAVDPEGPVYPGTCRNGIARGRVARATRFRAPHRLIEFHDIVHGAVSANVAVDTGDFVVKRADGPHAYQLAVVVDDLAQGVNQVVRGADLLSSTARQVAIIRALGGVPPSYAHLPLVTDRTGEKLSKRNGALPISALSERATSEALRDALLILGQRDVILDTPSRMIEKAAASLMPKLIPMRNVEWASPPTRQA